MEHSLSWTWHRTCYKYCQSVCVGWLADFFIQISQESFVTIDSLDLLHSLDTQVLCEHGECLCTSWCYGGSGAMAMRHGEGDQKRHEKRDVIYTYTLICMYRYQYQYVYIYIPSRYPIGITRDGRSGIFNWLTVYIDDFAKKNRVTWLGIQYSCSTTECDLHKPIIEVAHEILSQFLSLNFRVSPSFKMQVCFSCWCDQFCQKLGRVPLMWPCHSLACLRWISASNHSQEKLSPNEACNEQRCRFAPKFSWFLSSSTWPS